MVTIQLTPEIHHFGVRKQHSIIIEEWL